ncbi:MAG: virulence factor [Cyanobacteria bacterium SZAS-4]|nr:virulence factor [Cyanobacteria bacterium SZAS-4]
MKSMLFLNWVALQTWHMAIKSIETTPNPNSMKLNLVTSVEGRPSTFTTQQIDGCPLPFIKLLEIAGVQSIFVCNDFVTVNRNPTADWQPILDAANRCLSGNDELEQATSQRQAAEKDGQVSVFVQTFRSIPIQVKVVGGNEERRLSLGARFNDAAMRIQDATGSDFLKERYWAEAGVRYGTAAEVAQEVFEEITGVIDDKSLADMELKALGQVVPNVVPTSQEVLREQLASSDWSVRLKAVQDMGTDEAVLPLLITALNDDHHQVRRLAAAALGASGNSAAVEPLCQALLNDTSVGVKRTAGDALSDLGDVAAEQSMCEALSDKNKLVRWRAARFLAEVGSASSLPALQARQNDSEFEVRLEIETAIQRISGGGLGAAPAWKRIVENA